MQDLIIAGTGNSRTLKSVSDFLTQYPTYADFVAALVAGTLPVDIGAIDTDHVTQEGTPLNKANLLTDATAAAIWPAAADRPADPTVNAALGKLAADARIAIGSYVGTGLAGVANPCIITADFPIKIMRIIAYSAYGDYNIVPPRSSHESSGTTYETISEAYIDLLPTSQFEGDIDSIRFDGIRSNEYAKMKRSNDSKTVYWYYSDGFSYDAERQFNTANYIYYYLLIG